MTELHIRTTRPVGSNFTPADLIIAWAKEHRRPYAYNRYGRIFVIVSGLPFAYHHWDITPMDTAAATNIIDITLTQISAWDI